MRSLRLARFNLEPRSTPMAAESPLPPSITSTNLGTTTTDAGPTWAQKTDPAAPIAAISEDELVAHLLRHEPLHKLHGEQPGVDVEEQQPAEELRVQGCNLDDCLTMAGGAPTSSRLNAKTQPSRIDLGFNSNRPGLHPRSSPGRP